MPFLASGCWKKMLWNFLFNRCY